MGKYDEIVSRAKAAYGTGAYDDATIEFLVPDVKETEDERIRKEMIVFLKSEKAFQTIDLPKSERWIAWLEKQKEPEHFELKAGKWYICHRAFCCRADHLTVKEGERFQCEKDGIVKGFVIKEPEKYFKECSEPAPMEDEQKEQKPNDCIYDFEPSVEHCKYCSSRCNARITDGQKPNFSEKDSTDFEIEVHEIIAQARNDSRLNDADVLKQFEEEAAFALMLKANKLIEQKPAEWSEEDEKMMSDIIDIIKSDSPWSLEEEAEHIDWLKSLRPPQDRCKDCPHRGDMFLLVQGVKSGKHELAIRFMNYLDENRPEGKMGLSNSECEDIDKAFKENDWAKIMRYVEKYSPSWKPSEEQMKVLKIVAEKDGTCLMSLYNDLKKLM